MFRHKARIIVGLTTYYNENLMISLSGLSRIAKSCILVIHNDNPETKITARHIRQMGFTGELYIINSQHNIGLLNSRLSIIDFITENKLNSDWFVFADDDDILLNVDIPKIGRQNFAIIQNMLMIRTRLIDVLRAMRDPNSVVADNQNIFLMRPNIGLAGTLVRTSEILRLGAVLRFVYKELSDVSESIAFRAPIDAMMWSALNIVSRYYDTTSSPIYMDTVNYIAVDIDSTDCKYGVPVLPRKDAKKQIDTVLNRYNQVIYSALSCAFADAGQASEKKSETQ